MKNPRPWGLTPATDGTWYGHFDAVPGGWDYRPRRDMPWLHDGDGSDDSHPLMGEQIVQCRPPETEQIPWHQALGRMAKTGAGEYGRVIKVDHARENQYPWIHTDPDGPGNGGGIHWPARDGSVTVLVEGRR